MDNSAFRNLVSQSSQDASTKQAFKKPMALGSRTRTSIPMTPRNVPGYSQRGEFASQVAEHNSANGEPPLKKFKSSAAPKGTKLGAGYVDRASLRKGQEEKDASADKADRVKNLEEQLRLGQISEAQFENFKDQIGVGGDVNSTHLVKGLDWKLLERVRRGEDVTGSAPDDSNVDEDNSTPNMDVDEELEHVLEKDVEPRMREQQEVENQNEEGQQETLTRDEILRRFREQRRAPAVPAAPVLSEKFKRLAPTEKPGKKKFVESIDGRRREVLVITNKDGTTKRKTRWLDPEDTTRPEQQPLGMAVPAEFVAKQKAMLEAEAAEGDNDDIFAEAGDDYNPLAGIDSGSESGEERDQQNNAKMPASNKKRNYFNVGNETNDGEPLATNPMTSDPTILTALKRAAQIRQREENVDAQGDSETKQMEIAGEAKSSAFLAKLKERERQDAADFNYGFGESRFGDEDDDDGPGELFGDEGDKKKSGRKRGPKKRKGDKNNAQDVMGVLQGRSEKT